VWVTGVAGVSPGAASTSMAASDDRSSSGTACFAVPRRACLRIVTASRMVRATITAPATSRVSSVVLIQFSLMVYDAMIASKVPWCCV
jgi:hypothetical protein